MDTNVTKQKEPRFSLVCRAVVYQICLLIALQPAHPAFAEGIAVATGNTTINQAGNGVPVVNIATPNGAGVSHNLYQNFNVDQAGAILNNATGQLIQTQLGGLIQNNPNLNGQGANLIINEVVGATPSQLQGYLEVAGQQAGVVVANPNGLTCDGCGFINTPNVTLSTGKPVLDAQGQLQAHDVKQGTLTVGSKGLDATRQTSVDLMARAVELNGALHGQTVSVVAGANNINHRTGEVTAQAGNGPAPELAIDTSALGGMYANKIRLVSSEQGVGVNLANVVAKQGDLTLDANGKVRLSDSSATGALQVKSADDLSLLGKVQAGQGGMLAAQGVLSARDATIKTGERAQLSGRSVQLSQSNITSNDKLEINARDTLAVQGGSLQANTIDARANALDNRATLTGQEVKLHAEELQQSGAIHGSKVHLTGNRVSHNGVTLAEQHIGISARQLTNQGELKSGNTLNIDLEERGRNEGTMSSAGSLAIRVKEGWEQGEQGKSEAATTAHISAADIKVAGKVAANQLTLQAGSLHATGELHATNAQLNVEKLANRGTIQAGQALNWQGASLDNQGRLQGDNTLQLNGTTISNTGSLAGGNTLTAQAQTLINEGRIASQQMKLDAGKLQSSGTLLGVSRLDIKGDQLLLTGQQLTDGELQLGSRLLQLSGQTQVGKQAHITAGEGLFGGLLNAQSVVLDVDQATSEGKLHSRESVQWRGQRLATGQQSELLANHNVVLNGQQLTLGGTVGAGQGLDITGKQLTSDGSLVSNKHLKIAAGDLTLDGQVQGQSLHITSDNGRQRGRLLAADSLVWQSKQLDTQGWMQAGNSLTITGDTLRHQGTALTKGNMVVDVANLASEGGLFAHDMTLKGKTLNLGGTLESKGATRIAGDELKVGGKLHTGTDLTLGARMLALSGIQQVGGAMQLRAEQAELLGELDVAGELAITTGVLRSSGKTYAGQAQIDATQWTHTGALATDGALSWRGTDIIEQESGTLHAGDRLSLTGKGIHLAGGVKTKGDVNIAADQYTQLGTLNTTSTLTIKADDLRLGGTTQADAATLQSRSGEVDGKHLISRELVWRSDILANRGWLQAGEGLTLSGKRFDNEGTLIAGGQSRLSVQSQLTNRGNLAGKTLSLTAGELHNSGLLQGKEGIALNADKITLTGRLTSQGAVQLGATLLALGGEGRIGGGLTLEGDQQQLSGNWRVGGLLASRASQLTTSGDWQASQWQQVASTLTNTGRIASEQDARFDVGELHNRQDATLVAGGKLALTGKRLIQEGALLGAGDQRITVAELEQHGQWAGDGTIELEGRTLLNTGTLRASALTLKVNNLENRRRIESHGDVNWQGDQLRNQGALLAGKTELTGNNIHNSGDIGARLLTLRASGQLDNRGVLVGKEGMNLTAATLDSQGDMLSGAAMHLGAELLTLSGLTRAVGTLDMNAADAKLAGNIDANNLQWRGKSLVLTGTALASDATLTGQQIAIDGMLKGERQQLESSTLTTGKQSQLLAKEAQQLKAGQMTLQGKAVAGQRQQLEATTLTQQGVLASGDKLDLHIAGTLHNNGNISGQALNINAAHIDNGGALVSKEGLTLKTGNLTNRGHWQSDKGITLTATRLLNSGQWLSGLAQQLTLDTLDNSGTLLSGAGITLDARQLDQRGQLLATRDLTLNVANATLNEGSTTASNGRITLKVPTLLSKGTLSAAGALQWQGDRLNQSGTLITDGLLNLKGREMALGGALQGARLAIDTQSLTTAGSLTGRDEVLIRSEGGVQHDGQLYGGTLSLQSASWQGRGAVSSGNDLTLRTGQLQLNGPWRIRGNSDIQAENVTLSGSLISGGQLALTSRGALTSQQGSQLVSGGALTLTGGNLNQQGLWQSGQGMTLKGSRLEQQGDLLVGGTLQLQSGSWQHTGKTRVNGALNATLAESTTLDGTLQANGGIALTAPSLTLKGTLASQGNVNLSATALITQLGNLLSGGELSMNAANIAQQGRVETGSLQSRGEWQNDGVVLVAGNGALHGPLLANRGTLQGGALNITSSHLTNSGSLLGNTLSLTNGEVSNSGRLQANTLSLNTQTLNNAQGAVLRAQQTGNINATTLTNSGEISSTGALQLGGNQLDNTGLISGNWLAASPLAQLNNSGTLFGQQLVLKSAEIRAPGKILAAQKATIDAGRVTALGEWLSGGDLALNVGSSLTSQGNLSAKGGLDLNVQGDWQHQGLWGAGSRFNANVTGVLNNNKGSLVSNGAMQLNAQRLENSGSVQAGQGLGINTSGELRNSGMLAALGNLGWQGNTLFNSGTIYSGGSQNLTANSNLTNEYGTLLAERGATLKVNNGQLINASGIIDGGSGDLWLSAQDVINKRAVFDIATTQKSSNQQLPLDMYIKLSDPLVPSHKVEWIRPCYADGQCSWVLYVRFMGEKNFKLQIAQQSQEVKKSSSASTILSGGNLTIQTGSLINDASTISAGKDMNAQANTILNKSYALGSYVEYADYEYKALKTNNVWGDKSIRPPIGDKDIELYYRLTGTRTERTNTSSINSLISAGGNLTGTVAGMIDNVTIKANAGPVSSNTQRPAVSLPQMQGAAAAPGLQGDTQLLAQQLKQIGPDNGVPLPDFQLPRGDKGLFVVNSNNNSPYLIEVNPLLTNLGQSGNGMMDRIDNALQQQLQGPGALNFTSVGSGDWLSQAAGQGSNWSLPQRVGGAINSPAPQTSALTPLQTTTNSAPNNAAALLQHNLQNQWQGQPVAAVAVAEPQRVQLANQPTPAVTTAPRTEQSPTLTQVDKFLGSNYFFKQMNYSPEKDIKLLGDAAFDTRVIRDAVLAQTGRRFINGETGSDLAQMRTLIDNAAQNQRQLGLSPGVALSAAQVAQLGHSMVWWEPVRYQGKVVLAPKLYLTQADKRHLSGSVITAANIDLTAGGINNSGTLRADGTLSLKSGSTLVNQGQLLAGGRLELLAKGDIINQNHIKGGSVAIASINGSVRNETQTAQRHIDVNGVLSNTLTDKTRFSRTDIGDIARIESAGNLMLQAGKDISLSASKLLAGLDLTLNAGRDITINSLENRQTWEAGNNRFSRVDQLMSSLNSGDKLTLNAGNNLSMAASKAEAKGDIKANAGNNLLLSSQANHSSDEVRKGKKQTIDRTTTQVGATLSGDNVSLKAGNTLVAQASTVGAQGNASLQAGGQLQLLTADNEKYHFEKSKRKGTFSSKTTEIEQRDVTAQGTAITAGGNVSLASHGNMALKGSNINAKESLALNTDGQLKLLTATDEHFYRKDEQKKGFTIKAQGNGESSTTERQNKLTGNNVAFNAGQGVLLQVGQREGSTLQTNLTTLANQPGMAWVKQVSQLPGVKMEAVKEAYKQWDYKKQSLNPIVASVIAIAVAAASGGAGAALLGAQTAATTAMANTAFATLATQAAQSMVLNGGNLSAVLKELGSSANIKQLATSVATAGALTGFDQLAKLESAAKQANNPFAQPGAADLMSWSTFNRVAGHSTISAGISSTINGSSFGDAFKNSLLANIQGQVGKSTANLIGDNTKTLGEAGKIAAHGVTSGAIAEITGGKFAAGAAGGAMSDLASKWSLNTFGGNQEHQVALNKVLSGLAAVAVTGDQNQFDTGAGRAETVYRYNALEHQAEALIAQAKQDAIKAGMGDIEAKARVAAREKLLKVTGNLVLDLTPIVGPVKGFAEAQDAIDYALATITVIPGGNLVKGPLKAAKEALKVGDVETAKTLLRGVNEVVSAGAPKGLPVKGPKGVGVVDDFIPPGMNRPFRAVNPDFPPNKSVVDAMESPNIKNMASCSGTDCSEIASKLFNAAGGKGKVIEVRPTQPGNLTLFENGAKESGQYYHQVYTDGRYIYDPRLSPNPIPKGDWEQHVKGMNPEGVTISDKLKGLQ